MMDGGLWDVNGVWLVGDCRRDVVINDMDGMIGWFGGGIEE
jgi:hypothetical protein